MFDFVICLDSKLISMVYENVLSGSFIYSLGVVAGRKAGVDETTLDSINFFQQTPHDRKIGDLLADWGGKTFLIEFKRTVAQLRDELAKDGKSELRDKIANNKRIKSLSDKCHFLGYGKYIKQKAGGPIDTAFVFQSYLSVLTKSKSGENSLNSFIQNMNTNKDFGLGSRQEFENYLEFLLKHAEATATTSNSGQRMQKPITGIMTAVSPKGEVVSFAYQGYEHLTFLMNQKINLLQNLAHQMSYTQAPVISQSISKGKDKGQGQGFSF